MKQQPQFPRKEKIGRTWYYVAMIRGRVSRVAIPAPRIVPPGVHFINM